MTTKIEQQQQQQPSRVSVSDAAGELGVRVDEVYRLIRSNRLKAVKINKRLAVDYASLLEHIAQRNRSGNGR